MSFGEKLAMRECRDKLQQLKESKDIVKDYLVLFGMEIILQRLGDFIINDWICPKLAAELKDIYNDLIKKAAVNAEKIIMSFSIPSHAIVAPIANDYVKYNSYENKGELVNAKM